MSFRSRRLRSPVIRHRKTLNANICRALDYHKRDGNKDLTLCMKCYSDYFDTRVPAYTAHAAGVCRWVKVPLG